MQTPLISRTRSFSLTNSRSSRGFTLVELLVSIAVIVVITSIVLVRYDSFDSTTLLKNAAYDIALTLRDAQIKSVSAVRNGASDAKYPYGVTFTAGAGVKTFTMFRFASATAYPQYDDPLTSDLLTDEIERSMYVSEICIDDGGGDNCGISRLDISFRRPNFNAIFYAHGYAGDQNDIVTAKIKLTTTKGTGVFYVEVTQLGQISVVRQP